MGQVNTRLSVYDLDGKVVDNIQLDEKLFDGRVNKTLLYEAKKMYEANYRKGTAAAKNRSKVSGGGSKPWRQKGTGRARVGSSRNPVWRHGGVTFPPQPRDHSYSMPKKALRKAVISGLNARLAEDAMMAIVKVELKEPKTKEFQTILNNLNINSKTLFIVEKISDNVKRSSNNIKCVDMKEAANINARDILVNEKIVIEKGAVEKLVERLK